MRFTQLFPIVVASSVLLGCAQIDGVLASLNLQPTVAAQPVVRASVPGPYAITAVKVVVPRTLLVSEANVFKAQADVVWRGEPEGDRYAQVERIVTDVAQSAAATLTEGRKAVVRIEVTRFHMLSDISRKTVGGDYEFGFVLTFWDAETGKIIDGPRRVARDIEVHGWPDYLRDDAAGRTQIVTVKESLEAFLLQVLAGPVQPATGPQ